MRLNAVGAAFVAAGLLGWGMLEVAHHNRAKEASRLARIASSLAYAVQQEINAVAARAVELAKAGSIARQDMASYEQLLRKTATFYPTDYILTGRDYVQRINTSSETSGPGLTASRGMDDLNEVFGGAPLVVTPVRTNRYNGKKQFGVRVPVVISGRIEYVLTALVEPALIQDRLVKKVLPTNTFAGVLDGTGAIVARVPGGASWIGAPAPPSAVAHMKRADKGYGEIIDSSGRFGHTAFVTVPNSSWRVGVWSTIYVSSDTLARLRTVAFGIMALGAIMLLFAAAKGLRRSRLTG